MKDIYLNCDSKCISCPVFSRMIKISYYHQRKLAGSYYCEHCDEYSLCNRGLAFRRTSDGSLKPICVRCGRFVEKIELTYREGQKERPFSSSSLLFIRKPIGEKFDIIQTLKASYFTDLAEVLLYLLYTFGSNFYNIINYDTLTKDYQLIFQGEIVEENVAVKSDVPTTTEPSITFT